MRFATLSHPVKGRVAWGVGRRKTTKQLSLIPNLLYFQKFERLILDLVISASCKPTKVNTRTTDGGHVAKE